MSEMEENRYIKMVQWELDRSGVHKIHKAYTFKDFRESMAFVNRVAAIAEEERHHPDLHISYRKVIIEIHTHAILGLSVNDFILAAKIDHMANKAPH
jgi:4a-hydroxytetrahydrobiopterin dehydratase